MTARRPDGVPAAPPEPYEPIDPEESGAWPRGLAPHGPTRTMRGRATVTAAGDRIATAPDADDLGPSGGGPLDPTPRPQT